MSMQSDQVQRFLLEQANVRGEIAFVSETLQHILTQRPYPPLIQMLLGETLTACVLLSHTIKFEGSLSIQFEGNECLSLLLIQGDHHHHLRGLAQFKPDCTDEAYKNAFLNGQMVVTVQSKMSTQSYQSKIPIRSCSIADNLMYYFSQSDQIPSFVWLTANATQAGGFLLQLLPQTQLTDQGRDLFWEHALTLAQTMTVDEFFSLDSAVLLHRLYHDTTVRLFDPEPVQFRCRCTPERMTHVLHVLGKEACQQLLNTYNAVEVRCDFCNQPHTFDAIDIATLFQSL